MGRATRWMRLGYLGALVSSLLLLAGCFLFSGAPTAAIVATPLAGESPLVVTFNGSNSEDPEGGNLSYYWEFGDGVTSTEMSPHHTFIVFVGTQVFVVKLTVTDEAGVSDSVSQSIEVRAPEAGGGGTGSPIARITAFPIIGTTPLAVAFDATASEAGSGSITQIRWDFGDDEGTTGFMPTHTYRPDATKTFKVTAFVGNTEGIITAAQVEVIVIVPDGDPDGDDPEAAIDMTDPLLLYASPNPASTPTLYEVTFSSAGSFADPGHDIDYYAWDFGDGEWKIETTDADVTHVYELTSQARTYVARLIIYDDQGLEDTAVVNVSLAQPDEEDE